MRKLSLTSAMTCVAVVLLSLSAVSCKSWDRDRDEGFEPRMEFSIDSSRSEVVEGENVTFTARTANVGADHKIEWSTTSGAELQTDKNNRIARVRFDRPGTYVVTATLRTDDTTLTDTQTITVTPLSRQPR